MSSSSEGTLVVKAFVHLEGQHVFLVNQLFDQFLIKSDGSGIGVKLKCCSTASSDGVCYEARATAIFGEMNCVCGRFAQHVEEKRY